MFVFDFKDVCIIVMLFVLCCRFWRLVYFVVCICSVVCCVFGFCFSTHILVLFLLVYTFVIYIVIFVVVVVVLAVFMFSLLLLCFIYICVLFFMFLFVLCIVIFVVLIVFVYFSCMHFCLCLVRWFVCVFCAVHNVSLVFLVFSFGVRCFPLFLYIFFGLM